MPAIRVEKLSKLYRLGAQQKAYHTLRESIADMVKAPFRRLRAAFAKSTPATGEERKQGEDFWALRDVNFEINPGEVVGVIGRNGAGKSTLLKILSRITEPTSGRVVLKGRVGSLLEVGTGFHNELTGRENIFMNGSILGMSRREISRKFDEIVAFAEVEDFLDTPVKRYSSGMYVRLAFAVAAHLEPEILIIDEVLAVGDTAFQRKCLGKMQDVASHGRTVIFVSHNISAVQQLTHNAIYLKHGRLIKSAPTSEVVSDYLKEGHATKKTSVADTPRSNPNYGKLAKIMAIESHPGNESSYYVNEPLKFEVNIAAVCDMHQLRFGVTIFDVLDTPVMSMVTPSHITLRKNEWSGFELEIHDNRLMPGTYKLSLSLGEGGFHETRTEHDVVVHALIFEISHTTADMEQAFSWSRDYGCVLHPKESIQLTEIESSKL